jgi:hypothetical protein
MKLTAFLLVVFYLVTFKLSAQSTRTVSGIIKDTAGSVIEGATVKIAAASDTISSVTDKSGRFQFKNIRSDKFTIIVSSTGFVTTSQSYEFKKDERVLEIQPIILKTEIHQLQDVVVKSVIVPVTVKEDTVEYDARAYKIRDGDLVEDLLKQLPGIEVDNDGNVKAEGKGMTKLRVNGEDFFTNDVTTFIKQLPANIVSKLQVIDDYGDQANFTGIKTGEPQKMLNLVMKPGMSHGRFGNASINAGTNGVASVGGNANFWLGSKQISGNVNVGRANNKSLVSNNSGASTSYRDNWGKKLSFNASYNYNSTQSKSSSSTYNETLYPTGSLYTTSDYAMQHRSGTHGVQMGLNYNKDKTNYLTLQGTVNYYQGTSSNTSASSHKGIVFEDLQSASLSNQKSPNFSGSAYYSHRFKKPGRFVSLTLNLGASTNKNVEDVSDYTRYYDLNSGAPVKDSTLQRIVESNNTSTRTTFSFSYNEPINKSNFFDLSYSFNSSASNNSLITNVGKLAGLYELVDSLSNIYHKTFANHNLGLNYRHTAKGINYSAGLQLQPNTLSGEYAGRKETIHHTSVNFSPVANVQVVTSKSSSVNISYGGQSTSPTINQLQPVIDTRNLRNIVIGNPDLKPSFAHRFNVSYNQHLAKKGTMFFAGVGGSAIKDQVVSDVRLINDTVARNFRQETHFRNVNGNYNVGGNYSVSQPMFKNTFNVDVSGRIGYSRTTSFADNILNVGSNTQMSQSVNFRLYLKWLSLNGGVQYANTKHNYTVGINRNIFVETWSYNFSPNISIRRKFMVGLDVSKQANSGYYSALAKNPLYLNANVSFSFLKKDAGSLRIRANDLLNQGNGPVRMVTDNSITDSRSNYVTRYVLVSFTLRLNKFGGNNSRNLEIR